MGPDMEGLTTQKGAQKATIILSQSSSDSGFVDPDGAIPGGPIKKRVKVADQRAASPEKTDGCGEHDIAPTLKCGNAVTPRSSFHLVSSGSVSQRTPLTCKKAIDSLLLKEAGYSKRDVDSTSKRLDAISWDDYFMATASLSSLRSKDPDNATGACIVDAANRIIGTGYNGFPAGCSDILLPWTNTTNDSENTPWLHTKSPYMVHAETNAILNKCATECVGARLYTQYFPCNECAKVIAQAGISEVIYVQDVENSECAKASRILLQMTGVRVRQYKPLRKYVTLEFWSALNATEEEDADTAASTKDSMHSYDAFDVEYNVHSDLLKKEANYDPRLASSIKHKDNLSWDDYFLSMAFLAAQRSKDPNTQVGACIVDTNKRIVGLGYNGFPAGCSDDDLPWARKASCELHKKYLYVCHAEVNAILNKGSANLRGATLYVALFPCNECAKFIIQAGIREVVYMSDHYHGTDACKASRILFKMAGVGIRKHIPKMRSLRIDIDATSTEDSNNESRASQT